MRVKSENISLHLFSPSVKLREKISNRGATPARGEGSMRKFALVALLFLLGDIELKEHSVLFKLKSPHAKQVYLAGTFNNWAPDKNPMSRVGEYFTLKLNLPPGTYYYKFIVDGNWREDPDNPAKVADGFGGYNSVFVLTDDGEILLEAPREVKGKVEDLKSQGGTPLYFILLWHQHQPRYLKDPQTGEYLEPWVRLHGIKDYYDMASLVEKFPDLRVTINLTPVLLMQLEELITNYDRGKATDRYLRMTLKPAEQLTDEDKEFLLLSFFSANWANMIDIYPRYRELREKRIFRDGSVDIASSLANFTTQDYRDLQMWFNLAWFDPDFKEGEVILPDGESVTVKQYIEKGRDFTEADKKAIVELQFKILRAIIPIHKKLSDRGQVEVITTPYYHPILPLIYDNYLASTSLPTRRFSYPADAEAQVRLAVEKFRSIFGGSPAGMWPSEGAVSKEIIPIFADNNVQWIASDEKVLAKTLGKDFVRAEEKYKPYVATYKGKQVNIIFRDTQMSDAIGFRYHSMHPEDAAFDFISGLYEQYKKFKDESTPHVAVIILDGENAWENYPRDGKDFLYALYKGLTSVDWLKTTTVSDFLREFPPKDTLKDNLAGGSWINADLLTWIGEDEENSAWNALADLREKVAEKGITAPEILQEVYAVEGSDWFWWYGADQECAGGDMNWDRMFRATLRHIYRAINEQPPDYLNYSFLGEGAKRGTRGGVMARGESIRWFFSQEDKPNDDYGPGTYTYPTDNLFQSNKGLFDLRKYLVGETDNEVVFKLIFARLDNPWNAPLGFSFPIINIYLSTGSDNPKSTNTLFPGANVKFAPEYPWDFFIKTAGWGEYGELIFNTEGKSWRTRVIANPQENSVSIYVPRDLIGNPRGKTWAHYVLVGSQDGYGPDNFRRVERKASQWIHGGNTLGEDGTRVIDMLAPAYDGSTQEDMLKGEFPTIKPVLVKGE